MKIFTGIGSREISKEIENKIKTISKELYNLGLTLRSGAAQGSDETFESQYPDNKEIYLPWKNFNNHSSSLYNISDEALKMASENHPYWNKLSKPAKLLHSRNCFQVFGYDLKTPSAFVLAYTKDGCESYKTRTKETGGTGTAIEIASRRNIPVINMFNSNWYDNLILTLEELNI